MLDREDRRRRAVMPFFRGVKEKQTTDVIQAGGLSGSSLAIHMTHDPLTVSGYPLFLC